MNINTFSQSDPVEIKVNPPSQVIKLTGSGTVRFLFLYDRPSARPIKHHFQLAKAGSSLEILILVFGQLQDQLQLELEVEHLAPRTRCNALLKAIMLDESSLDFRGNLKILGNAAQSDTFLRCDSLLLSPKAQARTVPCLEIIASDVKAGHAASCGSPDAELMFYLQTRGFTPERSRSLLLEAFLTNSLNVFSSLSGRDMVSRNERALLTSILRNIFT